MESEPFNDAYFMQEALKLAERAASEDEVPIGAVVVLNNKIIGKGYNQTERLHDVTAHAEMLAITAACNHLNSKYLEECKLYVTIEPCPMCAGAIAWARTGNLIYGAPEPKFGYTRFSPNLLPKKMGITSGVLQSDCEKIMRFFFAAKRD